MCVIIRSLESPGVTRRVVFPRSGYGARANRDCRFIKVSEVYVVRSVGPSDGENCSLSGRMAGCGAAAEGYGESGLAVGGDAIEGPVLY